MSEDNLDEISEDFVVTPFVCSQCDSEVLPEAEPWPEFCPTCQQPFDLQAQFAYSRGQDAFNAGQELIIHISPKVRRRNLATESEMEGVQYYIQAYTALQESFKGELADSQHHLGIEMMAAIVRVFMQHDMISPLESSYWVNLLIEMNSLKERAALLEKLENRQPGGIFGLLRRWRWRSRLYQLDKGLAELDAKIVSLERNIAFVDPPRARQPKQLHRKPNNK